MELKSINFGIIGFGFMGKTHAANIVKHPNAQLKAIYTLPELTKEITYDVKIYSDSWQKLVDDAEVEAIVVATPTTLHCEMVEYIAKTGKAIFLEKPMARTREECDRIVQAIQNSTSQLFMAHVLRFWPSYDSARNAVFTEQSSIGDIKMIRAQRFSTLPGWSQWFLDEKLSGGCILDLSIHDIDYTDWLMNKPIKSLYCEARKIPELNIDNWGVSFTTITYMDGSVCHCEASWMATPSYGFGTACEIIGTEGIVQFNSGDAIPMKKYGESVEILDPMTHDGYYIELDSFISSLLNDLPMQVTMEDGKKAVQLCLAAIKSAQESRVINWEEIING